MPQSELHDRFRSNLRAIRMRKKLTQAAVAARLGVSRAYVTEIESGRHVPSLLLVEQLADALDVQPETFLKKQKNLSRTA